MSRFETGESTTIMKINKYLLFAFLLVIIAVSSFITYKITTLGSVVRPGYQSKYTIMNAEYWRGYENVDPVKRIEPLENKDVLEYLEDVNHDKSVEVLKELTAQEQQTIQEFYHEIEKWPVAIKNYFWKHVAKIYIVDGLYSSGRAECMDDGNTFIIFLNRKKLHQSPNDWIGDAEASAVKFVSEKEKIEFIIEDSDSPALTLENIVVHELGHIVSLNKSLLPDWRVKNDYASYPVVKDAFYQNQSALHRKGTQTFVFEEISYYGGEENKISIETYLSLVDQMRNTSFPSLYGSQNANEYFAEMFYGYMHCIIQKKPYKEKVTSSNGQMVEFFNGMTEVRCGEQYKMMKSIFESL